MIESMERDDLKMLVRASAELQAPTADFERRVMIEVARRAIERSRRRARRGVIASLSGLAMLLAACVAALVVWFPARLPAFARSSWLEVMRSAMPDLDAAGAATGNTLPFFEQWGGLTLLVLTIGGAAGFIYYLNTIFAGESD